MCSAPVEREVPAEGTEKRTLRLIQLGFNQRGSCVIAVTPYLQYGHPCCTTCPGNFRATWRDLYFYPLLQRSVMLLQLTRGSNVSIRHEAYIEAVYIQKNVYYYRILIDTHGRVRVNNAFIQGDVSVCMRAVCWADVCDIIQYNTPTPDSKIKQMFLSLWCEHTYSRINMWYGMWKLFSSMFWAIFPFIIFTESWPGNMGEDGFLLDYTVSISNPWSHSFGKNLTSEHYRAPNLKCTEETPAQGIMMGRTEDSEEWHKV